MSINIPTAYKIKVSLSYGELKPVIEWCERNCTGDWRFMEDPDNQWGGYVFFFDTERDYVAFSMWNK